MHTKQNELFGAVIGYVRATEGDMNKITDEGDILARMAVGLTTENAPDLIFDNLIEKVTEEKFKVVPGCKLCANPCGRTSAFDMRMLDHLPERTAALKKALMAEVQRIAHRHSETIELPFYQGMFAIGDDSYNDEQLATLLEELKKA